MSEEKKHDHGPNMAALQTYQTSFASGDLEKIMGVLVGTYKRQALSEFDKRQNTDCFTIDKNLLILFA